MKLTDLTIRDLFTPGVKLTFLVGAGCSIDKPSCLPAGRRMMNALLDYTCAKSELDKIKKLEGLRFEQLIEILSERLDPELKIIDFYGLCDKPNLQHFFLAEMMNQGHFVFTTNFDFLIEYALIHSGVPKNKIKVVITKEDFEKFDNPHELYSDGLKTLYKIHGSTENIITGIPTRASLIATIQAFGANKEGENAFQLEGFKQPAFLNLTKDRTLVVLGYSGSDDFDVVPTLKVLEDVRDIIWINHIQNDKKKENVYEIRVEDIQNYETLAKVDQILVDIKRMNYVNRVFRVDINTSIMVKELVSTQNEISSDIFDIDIHEWLSNNIETPNEVTQLYVPYKIYFDFDLFEDALPILDKMLKFAEEKKDLKLKTFILSAMGSIYEEKGEIQDALTLFEEALQLDDHLEDSIGKATRLNNIGGIYYAQGHYQEALKRYKEVLQIDEQSKNSSAISIDLNNIGMIFRAVGNYPKALILFKKALKISENLGNLKSKAVILNNLGGIYRDQGDYQEASKRYEEALQINVQLGDLRRKALLLNNIGGIYKAQKKYQEALNKHRDALQIDEKLGNLSGKATDLNNIAEIFNLQKNYQEALKNHRDALRLTEQLGDLSRKAASLNNIGLIYKTLGKYPEALELYEEALQIDEESGDQDGKATRLNNIGAIYKAQGNYQEALRQYKNALDIFDQLGELAKKPIVLYNIGKIYEIERNYTEALRQYNNGVKILTEIGLSESLEAKLIKESIDKIKEILKKQSY